MIKRFLTALAIAAPMQVSADPAVVTMFDGDFGDATFALESAILDRGLVIDYVSHVGEMLERTRADVGSDTQIFANAQIFVFCSAVVSREVMEENPMNIAFCPYSIFVAETDDGVMFGRQDYPAGPMDKVEALIDGIIAAASDG